MVALKESRSPLTTGGFYIIAGTNGSARALVDPHITRAMPKLTHAIECIGHILQRCAPDEELAVSVKLERGPKLSGLS